MTRYAMPDESSARRAGVGTLDYLRS
jgi:hypothetical protein